MPKGDVSSSPELAAALSCNSCGYDLRAQPPDGHCPECGLAVAESRRMKDIPKRPAWRDSDLRWRRRMIAGAWVLVLLPAMAVMQQNRWLDAIPIPALVPEQAPRSLDDSLLVWVYAHLIFCVGAVLFFSKERGRQPGRFDRLRPWGIVASYGAFLFGFIQTASFAGYVTAGIGALFNATWPPGRPAITDWLTAIGGTYLRYGPYPSTVSDAAAAGVSSIVILLACVPLFNALRSSGPRTAAVILLSPLALSAAVQLGYAVYYGIANPATSTSGWGVPDAQAYLYQIVDFFRPDLLGKSTDLFGATVTDRTVFVEYCKWLSCVGIALWLTIAQVLAIVRRREPLEPLPEPETIPD